MPRVVTPFLGGTYQSRSLLLNDQRAINIYPEMVESRDGKTVGAFYGCPGLLPVYTRDDPFAWRALHAMGSGALFGVLGDAFVQIGNTYRVTWLGSINSMVGPVSLCDNGNQMLIVDGLNAYGYDMTTGVFATITLPFTTGAPIVCAYQDGFFLINQTGTTSWWQSNINDAFTWNGLNFSSKDGQPDPIVMMIDNHREVWLFGTQTTEVWINVGSPGFSFQRLQGVFIQHGIAAPYSAQIADGTIIWLSKSKEGQGSVLQTRGYATNRVSTHAIERQIQSYPRIDDATAYVYEQEAHLFYVLNFPSADATWCYDVTTGLWHERASFVDGLYHRHRSNCCAIFKGVPIVGDFENGNLYQLDLNTYTDNGEKRKRVRTWPAQSTGKLTHLKNRYDRLEIYTEPAGHLGCDENIRVLQSSDDDWRVLQSSDDDVRVLSGVPNVGCEEPQYMLRWSDDGGLSWSNEHWVSAGKIGETKLQYIWRRLGSGRDRIFELSATDPFADRLVGAWLDYKAGVS
jgi:hypothetical protein